MPFDWVGPPPRSEVVDFLDRTRASITGYADLDRFLDDPARGFAAAAGVVDGQARRYGEPFRLVVVGDFNAGKSSLINALLARKDLLAERRVATTASVTELWYGDEDSGTVCGPDSAAPVFSGELAQAVKYADQNSPEGKSLAGRGGRIVLRLAAPLLRNLVVIDTPGLGASVRDNKVTREALDIADAAVLVVSALQPGAEETGQLAEWLRVHRRRVLLVVTWLDKVDDPDDRVDAIATMLGPVVEGAAVRVDPPAIHQDLADLEAAELREDTGATLAAKQRLEAHGYIELVDRLQSDFAFGDAGLERLRSAMSTVASTVRGVAAATRQSIVVVRKDADAAHEHITDLTKRIYQIVPDKRLFLNEKIDEAVRARIAEFIVRLGEAIELFIDKLAAGGLRATARAVQAVTEQGRRKVATRVQRDFDDLFPSSQLKIVIDDIARVMKAMLEAEWGETTSVLANFMPAGTFNIDTVTRDVSQLIAVANAAAVGQAASWVWLLFGPAGVVFDLALFVLTALWLKPPGVGRSSAVARQKREARIRLGNLRADLVHAVSRHYREANEATCTNLLAAVRKEHSGQAREYDELQARLHRLDQAVAGLGSIEAGANGLAGQDGQA